MEAASSTNGDTNGADGELRLSLDGNVHFSQNPMIHAGPNAPGYDDSHMHFDHPASTAVSAASTASQVGATEWAMRNLMKLLPRTYFRPEGRKLPVAPPRLALFVFVSELAAVIIVFSVMCWYFRTSPTQQTTISLAPLPGQTCSVLNPRKDTVFYSAEHSENAQFASPYMTSTKCVSLLTRLDVCGDGRRLDHVTLWGVSNPNTTHYYSGGEGYFSFTPTQTPGLVTQLVPFFQPSVSFPRPDISRPAYFGPSTNWYLFNFARNTAADAFSSFCGVFASTFLYDASTNIVYDPEPTSYDRILDRLLPSRQRDYNLVSSSPNDTALDVVGTMDSVTGGYYVSNLGVNAGVYYGLRGAATFYKPIGVAVDAASNIFVADSASGLIRRINALTQVVTNLGTSASPAFSNLTGGVAVDAAGNVYVTESDTVRVINATTQVVTNLGTSASPAFSNLTGGVAVDAAGNVYVTESDTVRVINATTQAVTILGISASPAFSSLTSVAVDAEGNVFVADSENNRIRMIDATTQAVTSLGTSASPAFNWPHGVAVDAAGNVYVADTLNHLVRRIDATTQAVTNLGSSASPAFNVPVGVAVDAAGRVFVTDTFNGLVRMINPTTQVVSRFLPPARVLSWDMQNNPDPSSFTLWPDTALTDHHNFSISVVDSAAGGCQNVIVPGEYIFCFLLAHAEVSPVSGRLYLEFHVFKGGAYFFTVYILILDPTQPSEPAVVISIGTGYGSSPTRQLWGVFNTPVNGTVLLMTEGAANNIDEYGDMKYLDNSAFTKLVTAAGTSIVDASAIPSKTPGEPARFLLLTLREKGLNTMYTYDTFTDTITSSNAAAAATTHAMLAFTWGVCDGTVTRRLVELSFSNAYSNECPLPKTGLYYQSPNVYYPIPYACLAIPYDKLLTDCPEIRANMKVLVDASCPASIAKVCRQQYDLNPPFSCVTDVYPSALTVISLSGSNAMALSTFLALVVAALLARAHRHYRPSEQDIALANARPLDRTDAADADAKSGKQACSGPAPGIEMLPPSAHAASTDGAAALTAVRSVQGAQMRMETDIAKMLDSIASLHKQLQLQQQEQLQLRQQQYAAQADKVPPPMPFSDST